MRNLFLLLSFAFLLGCSSDSDSNETTPTNEPRLKRIVTHEPEDDETLIEDFVYNSNRLIRIDSNNAGTGTGSLTFSYTGQRVSKLIRFNEVTQVTDEIILNYTGEIITSYARTHQGQTILNTSLTHDAEGNVLTATSAHPQGAVEFEGQYGYDSNHNQISTSEAYAGLQITYTSVFDDKKHPYSNTVPEALLRYHHMGNNNMVSNNRNGNTYVSYEYNEEGYPVSSTHMFNGTVVKTVTYEYE